MDTAREISGWQRGVMIGAPLLLGCLLLLHPNSNGESPDEWVQQLASIRERWLLQHILQMPLFAVLGLIVLWMLPGRGTASQVSQIALGAYMVLYPAFDALVGIGSGFLLEQRSMLGAADQPVLDRALQALFFDPTGVPLRMAIVASTSWSVGAVAGAISLWRPAGWQVAAPLLVSGVALGVGHVPPLGPLAGVMLATASWQFLTRVPRHALNVPAAATA